MNEHPFEQTTPDRLDCHTAHHIAAHAAAHGWHTVAYRGLAGSDTPGRVDETLVLRSPDQRVEVWLMMHDVDDAGIPDDLWWRIPKMPAVHDLQLLRNLIRELGVIDLRTVA